MNAIIGAQGTAKVSITTTRAGARSASRYGPAPGVVAGIDNYQIARIARLAGAPKVQGRRRGPAARKLGDPVSAGDLLYRVHAGYPADLEFARHACARSSGYTMGSADEVPHVLVEF
jgi:thymidine phosphorylase